MLLGNINWLCLVVTDWFVANQWTSLIGGALGEVACLTAKLTLQVDHVTLHMGHGSASDDAQLVAALVLMLIPVWTHQVG